MKNFEVKEFVNLTEGLNKPISLVFENSFSSKEEMKEFEDMLFDNKEYIFDATEYTYWGFKKAVALSHYLCRYVEFDRNTHKVSTEIVANTYEVEAIQECIIKYKKNGFNKYKIVAGRLNSGQALILQDYM